MAEVFPLAWCAVNLILSIDNKSGNFGNSSKPSVWLQLIIHRIKESGAFPDLTVSKS